MKNKRLIMIVVKDHEAEELSGQFLCHSDRKGRLFPIPAN